ncbi:hypothetical protein [Maridesulfovibrio sp.]|uniref:hypothetical protein n=1 Tax=Maridesulfovibrio sp. TaxID=2795000 RepID=UPI002A18E72C|nr:hypothetical protein [Maridesulfovibrio sp.]
METLLLTAGIFVAAFAALAIGVMFKRGCIRGSCHGTIQSADGSGCKCGRYDIEKKCAENSNTLKPLM